MHRDLAVLLALAAAGLSGQAIAQSPPKPTTAPVVLDEVKARAELTSLFTAVDTNKDGRMSRREMQVFGIQHRIGTLINTRAWKRADKDRNNWISLDEFINYSIEERRRNLARANTKRR